MLLKSAMLSDEQRTITKHQRNPTNHLMIDSVPGSGKSSLIEFIINDMPLKERERTQYLVYGKENAVSFNKRFDSNIARTSSSLGYHTLRQSVKPNDQRSWVRSDKYKDIAETLISDGDFFTSYKDHSKWVESAVRLCGLARSNLVEMSDHPGILKIFDDHGIESPIPREEIGPVIHRMMQLGKMRAARYIDFIDQLWLPHVMELEPTDYYERLFVDEAQDTSYAARSLLMKAGSKGKMTWVGDPRQAIYRWAGAPPKGMDEISVMTGADTLSNPTVVPPRTSITSPTTPRRSSLPRTPLKAASPTSRSEMSTVATTGAMATCFYAGSTSRLSKLPYALSRRASPALCGTATLTAILGIW
jgi:hypothetical protein